jgi:DNA ligase (NAD+)
MKADEIVRLLNEARDAYYNSDSPVMSDAEFDELEEKLRSIDPANPYFTSVGMTSVQGVKISHATPMLSMAKAKNMDDMVAWIKKLAVSPGEVFVIEPKIDGLSATCMYSEGRLVYVATRGDGMTGQDITHIANYVKDIRRTISLNGQVEVRGELYLPRGTPFDTEGKPLRNACVGLINRKENRDDLKYVRFAVFQLAGPEQPLFESERIALLKREGFNAVRYSLAQDIADISGFFTEYMGTFRDEWDYETDGLIVSVDDRRLFDEIDSRWVVDHHHHYAIALKPPARSRETFVRDVIWQVSRQGNIIPVALFEPVVIGGAKLERATLNNYMNVKRLMVQKGDKLLVQRANDVIPFVQDNLSSHGRSSFNEELMVKTCPSCGSVPEPTGVHIKCLNQSCEEQIIQRIIYWVKSCSIENVAEATVRTLFKLGRIKNIRDLYNIKEKDFEGVEGFAQKKIDNFIKEINSSKKMTVRELLSRLGIPMVQEKALAKLGISSIDDFMAFSDDIYVTGKNIIEWKNDPSNMAMLNELLDVLEISSEPGSQSRGKVCMTGTGPAKRKDLIKLIEEMGYEFSATVTRDLDILVCEDPEGKSSKLDSARKNNIRLMSYDEFFGDRIAGIEG